MTTFNATYHQVFLLISCHSHFSIFVLAGREFFLLLIQKIHMLLFTKSLVPFLVLFSESPRLHDGQHLFLLFFFTIPITLLLFNYSVFDCQLAIRELLVVFVLANYHLDLPFQAVNLVFIIIFHLFQSLSCLLIGLFEFLPLSFILLLSLVFVILGLMSKS